MPSSSSERTLARRVLIEDIRKDRKSWLRHGVAALAVSVLGLGVAGSVALTGAAQHTTLTATVATTDLSRKQVAEASGADSIQRESRASLISGPRSSARSMRRYLRPPWTSRRRRATRPSRPFLMRRGVRPYCSHAGRPSAATTRHRNRTPTRGPVARAACQSEAATGLLPASARSDRGRATTPVWTSPLPSVPHCTLPLTGVVTNAGIGSASGWAGNYVAIKHANGTHTLMAHMSNVSVSVGQTVSACQIVGAVGMTGRTFGAHVHFEVYPAGVEPGDIYSAVNPRPWLNAHGVNP